MKIIKIDSYKELPNNFTGVAEYVNGSKVWYKEGLLHRLGGPACEYNNGDKYWYKEGKLHRLDGPARERALGCNYWYVESILVTEQDYPQAVLDYKLKMVLES